MATLGRNECCSNSNSKFIQCLVEQLGNKQIIPNTAVFGPTKLIETTIASTMARMKISAEDFG